jgi:hypothetical protein
MKLFACSRCQQLVFFENITCTRCGQALAYLPDREQMSGIDRVEAPAVTLPGGAPPAQLWRAQAAHGAAYRLCRNWTEHAVCNWAVPVEDPHELCQACRLNLIIPRLSDSFARTAWARLEVAKRRLVYSLLRLGLPVAPKGEAADGLAFSFMQDRPGEKVSTGHDGGVITINIAEADDPFREKMRARLDEPYRTLLGHFRHEIGHYYWARLVRPTDWLSRCRALFGDDRADYAGAVERHYETGAPPDWPARFVSAYASTHPWEDWAETFAHYLHMVDTLETARAYGLSVLPEPTTARTKVRAPAVSPRRLDFHDFGDLLDGFAPVTLVLNDLNRSMGLPDPYPFVLSPIAVEKLRFVHDVLEARSEGRRP